MRHPGKLGRQIQGLISEWITRYIMEDIEWFIHWSMAGWPIDWLTLALLERGGYNFEWVWSRTVQQQGNNGTRYGEEDGTVVCGRDIKFITVRNGGLVAIWGGAGSNNVPPIALRGNNQLGSDQNPAGYRLASTQSNWKAVYWNELEKFGLGLGNLSPTHYSCLLQ